MANFVKYSLCLLLVFLLLLSIVNGAIVYISQTTGVDVEGCGTASQSPCATLLYVFDPAYNLPDASIVQLSEGTYDATGLQITQTDITIESDQPTKMAEINIVGTEGITVLADGLILQNLEFKNIDIEGNLFEINVNQGEITLVRCNFESINAFYIFQGEQDLDFINFSVLSAYDINANSFFHASTKKFTLDFAMFTNSNYSGAAINIVSSDITATDTRLLSTYFQTGLFLISTNYQSEETTENITISTINGSDITTEHPLINIGVNQENTYIDINTVTLSSTIGPIIAIASEQHYGVITIDNVDLTSANVDSNSPTWLFNIIDADSVVVSNINVQNSLANLLYVDEILSQNFFNILITNSWQRESLFSSLIYFTNSVNVSLSNVTLTNNENLEGDIQFSNIKTVTVTDLTLTDNQFNQEGAILLLQNTETSVLNNCNFVDNINSATISVVRSNYDFISKTTIENTNLDTLYFDCSSNSTLFLQNNTYGISYCASVNANPNYSESDDVCKITGSDVIPCEDEDATATEAWYAIVMIVVFGLIGLTVFTVIIVSAVYFLTKRRQAYSAV